MTKPQPPPEAVLVKLVREAAHVKTVDAAKAAGISKARWSQIENGYESRLGRHQPVIAPARTLAHMAAVVRISPERLEAEGERPDAAVILREIIRQNAEAHATIAELIPDPPPGTPDFVLRYWDDPDVGRAVRSLWLADAPAMTREERLRSLEGFARAMERREGRNGTGES